MSPEKAKVRLFDRVEKEGEVGQNIRKYLKERYRVPQKKEAFAKLHDTIERVIRNVAMFLGMSYIFTYGLLPRIGFEKTTTTLLIILVLAMRNTKAKR